MNPFLTFNDILEYLPIPQNNTNLLWDYQLNTLKISSEFLTFQTYIHQYCPPSNTPFYIVSLSGGVDSMLITCFLKNIITDQNKIIAAHINYHQRGEESNREDDFLKKWCEDNQIVWEKTEVIGYNRKETGQREEFETESTQIRYDFYQQLLLKYKGAKGIFLGHHHDDRAENIYTNIMRGRSIIDLSVLKPMSIIRQVPIMRPLLGLYKPEIFEIAGRLNIPYFKDTTPDWSNRGILRRQIFPMFEKQYGNIFRYNLNRLGDQSDFMMVLINNSILKPVFEKIKFYNKDGFIINFNDINPEYHNQLIWGMIWEKACHEIGIGRVGNKKLDNFLNIIKNASKSQFVEIHPEFKCFIDLDKKEITLFNKIKYKNKKDFTKQLS